MPYFVISGKPNCPQFMHATHVAKYLSERLPNFVYQKVEKLANEWAEYINKLNRKNGWFITESPLIWKEINIWGGKKHLIGGISEFWEYVHCYYGLESIIPNKELQKLAEDNLKFFLQHQKVAKEIEKNVRVIAIYGSSVQQTYFLIDSLLRISNLEKQNGMCFKLYDTEYNLDKYKDTMTYFNNLSIYGNDNLVTISDTEEEFIKDIDILIHVEDFQKETGVTKQEWLKRCFISMQLLADILNKYARRNCVVIMNNHGPVCYLATCLVEMCTRLRPSNIVAVTADVGLSFLNAISEVSGVPVDKLNAPPVWGFVGLNSFVDERNTVTKADIHRPYERALTAPIGSTLPLGTMQSELRLLTNLLTDHDEIRKTINERHAKMIVRLNRVPVLAKIRAVTSLLELWFANTYSDDIISLGVCSNGSFGITPGIVFSQPVKLDDRGKWVPFHRFPLLNDFTINQIQKCVSDASEILQLCGMQKSDIVPLIDVNYMDSDSSSTQDGEYIYNKLDKVESSKIYQVKRTHEDENLVGGNVNMKEDIKGEETEMDKKTGREVGMEEERIEKNNETAKGEVESGNNIDNEKTDFVANTNKEEIIGEVDRTGGADEMRGDNMKNIGKREIEQGG